MARPFHELSVLFDDFVGRQFAMLHVDRRKHPPTKAFVRFIADKEVITERNKDLDQHEDSDECTDPLSSPAGRWLDQIGASFGRHAAESTALWGRDATVQGLILKRRAAWICSSASSFFPTDFRASAKFRCAST